MAGSGRDPLRANSTTLLKAPRTPRDLGFSVLDLPQARSGEKRGSRRECIAPLPACSRAPATGAVSFSSFCCVWPPEWLQRGWWLHAFESATKARQPAAEPVGAVDEDDLLKAGGNDANWLMYGRTYNGHRYSSAQADQHQERRSADPASGPSRPACSTASNARRWSSTASCT